MVGVASFCVLTTFCGLCFSNNAQSSFFLLTNQYCSSWYRPVPSLTSQETSKNAKRISAYPSKGSALSVPKAVNKVSVTPGWGLFLSFEVPACTACAITILIQEGSTPSGICVRSTGSG